MESEPKQDGPTDLAGKELWQKRLSIPRFALCMAGAVSRDDLIREFDRLSGTNLSNKGSPIDLAIDRVTGKHEADLLKFFEFVWEYIYLRLPEPKKKNDQTKEPSTD